MHSQRLLTRALALTLAGLATLGASACGPNPGGKVPVSSPVYAFQAPDPEDFAPDSDDDDEDDTSSSSTDSSDDAE